jgi:hypothetical protein
MAEQAQRIAIRSIAPENVNHTIDKRELYPLIAQLVNQRLNIYSMDADVIGDISIPACAVASYELPVIEDAGKYYSEIPVMPIRLPRDMGVWSVTPINGELDMIPVMPSLLSVLGGTEEIELEGNIGYVVSGGRIKYLKKPEIGTDDVEAVVVQLLVYPIDAKNPNSTVPIYADLEAEIVMEAAKIITAAGSAPDMQMARDTPAVQAAPDQTSQQ